MECHESHPENSPVARGFAGHLQQARRALRAGRYRHAIEHVHLARRHPLEIPPALLALIEVDALLRLGRHRDALMLCGRALRRRDGETDLVARLRLARASALWHLGEVGKAIREVERVAQTAQAGQTGARLEELRARIAWNTHDADRAMQHLLQARSIYLEVESLPGVERTLEQEAAVLRDLGRLNEALRVHAERIEGLLGTGNHCALACARADRGAILAALGRWVESREELQEAARIFHDIGDQREHSMAGIQHAVVELAMGNLEAARSALEHGRAIDTTRTENPRLMAEILLLLADVHLACSDAPAAQHAAAEAASLFGLARNQVGQAWGWIRLSQALLALDDHRGALRQAQRALRQIPSPHRHLRAWAHLALGRVFLRTGSKQQARLEFEQALSLCADRREMSSVCQLGLAMTESVGVDDDRIVALLEALEHWGDRSLRTLCLRDVRGLLGADALRDLDTERTYSVEIARDAKFGVLVDLSLMLRGSSGLAEVLHMLGEALRPFVSWQRIVVLLGREAWQLLSPDAPATPLSCDDLAWELSRTTTASSVVDLLASRTLREHPTRVLHGLAYSVVLPVSDDGRLFVDLKENTLRPTDSDCALFAEASRLVGPYLVSAARERSEENCGIIGGCPAMLELRETISRVAPSDLAIHIYGETGTGKELVARAVHNCSTRREGPFVAINASSIPEALFEAQMFGHARGAFTGAERAIDGHVARAHRGTLFLDEVADLSLSCQAKLLRFCQDGTYYRLGETTPSHADVRLITATNVELCERVAIEGFRKDLMYRLRIFTLRLPPLRERGQDIATLARHFLRLASKDRNHAALCLTPEIARILDSYGWPGNVRELEMQMRRLAVLAGTGRLRKEYLSPEILTAVSIKHRPLRETRLDHERSRIVTTLADHAGNRSQTAAALGLSRQGLLVKIRRMGIA